LHQPKLHVPQMEPPNKAMGIRGLKHPTRRTKQ
jgi:hypothetical protein